MKTFARIYVFLVLLILPIVLLASWVVGAYNDEIRNLLDADGVRWGLTHILSNYRALPLSSIIFVLITSSIVHESGWLDWMYPSKHPLTLKQLRAYTYSNLLFIILAVSFASVLMMPASPLLNSFGGLDHSPIVQGGFSLFLLVLVIMSNVYGFLSGRLSTVQDFAFAHSKFLIRFAPSFITLFLVSQIGGCLAYSHLADFTDNSETIIVYILIALSFVGY